MVAIGANTKGHRSDLKPAVLIVDMLSQNESLLLVAREIQNDSFRLEAELQRQNLEVFGEVLARLQVSLDLAKSVLTAS